ncbi:MAG: hypothetical protein H6738_24480 [Alphaproteobacteria bacterium]|nr:hypothetical protein [Alphaproteobacteria bacterium]MCB9699967.1 hypothetical protein [Alphaproteobacteria bacterium]
MSLYRHVRPVLSMREPAHESQTGPVFVIFLSETDPTPDHALGFRLLVQALGVPEAVVVAPAAPAPVPAPPPSPVLPRLPVGSAVPRAPLPAAPAPAPAPEEDAPEPAEPVEHEPIGGGTVVIETSADRKQWVPVHEPIDLEALPLLTDEVVLGPYVRARTEAEVEHQVDVHLLGTASYRLELA